MTRRRIRAAATLAVLITLPSCGGATTFGFPDGATEQARRIIDVWGVFMITAFFVAGAVYAGIVWTLLRYRTKRHDPDAFGDPFHANVPIEVAYTVIPILIIVGLFVVSLQADGDVRGLSEQPDETIEVTAFAWGWRFEYPERDIVIVSPPARRGEFGPEMVLPLERTTRIVLTSNDMIHAFWVPSFNFKLDAIPGHVNEFDLTPVLEGSYLGVCAEFCGIQHAYMTFRVTTMPAADFDAWAAEQVEDDEDGEAAAA